MAGPSHVDLSVLWVPIMPETSKVGPAMEQAGQEATENFDKGSSGLGDRIHEKVSKSADKLKDIFHKSGKDSGDDFSDELEKSTTSRTKSLGDNLGEMLGTELGRAIGENLRQIPIVDQLATSFQGVASAVDHIKTGNLAGVFGDFSGVLHNLEPIASKFGLDISSWPTSIQNVVIPTLTAAQTFGNVKDNLSQVSTLFGGIEKDAPGIAGAFGKIGAAIGELAGPLALGATLGKQLADTLDNIPAIRDRFFNSDGSYKNAIDRWASHVPILNLLDPDHTHPGSSSPALPFAPDTGTLGNAGATGASVPPPSALGGAGALPAAPITPGTAGIGGAGGSSAAPSGFSGGGNAVPLIQNPDGTWTSPNPSWAHLIQRESGGRNVRQGIIDVNSGGNEAEGLFQITPATWRSHGGTAFAPNPLSATPQQQAAIAARILQANPSGSDWGAGMSGRESASGLLAGLGASPAGLGSSSGYNFYKDWYPAGGSSSASVPSGGGGGGSRAGGGVFSGGATPLGTSNDPLYVTQADTGGGAGASTTQDQAQQLGQGMFDGMLQAVGLDGSVFKSFGGSSNPLQFGITKLATGLLNWGGGMAQRAMGGDGAALPMGGGGGGIPGLGMVPGIGNMMHPGGIPIGPGGAQNVPTGDTHNHYYGDIQPFNVTQNGVGGGGVPDWKEQYNAQSSRSAPLTTPNAGNLPSGGGL